MRVAILCSAHGFGHTGRQLALVDALVEAGDEVDLYTAVPVERLVGVPAHIVPWVMDVGIRQHDSVREDPAGTVPQLEARSAEAAVSALADAVRGVDVAVVDIAPAGLEACRRAGVPALAVGNFDWPWIYDHYPELAPYAARLRGWHAGHAAAFLAPGPGLFGFGTVAPYGLLGRTRQPRRVAERAVVVGFGGLGLDGLDQFLPRIDGVAWVLAPPLPHLDRADVVFVESVPFPSLVAGADLVLTKPGYGIFAEAALAGTPLVWIERGAFPEAPFLEAAMWERGDEKVAGSDVAGAVARRLSRPRPAPMAGDAASRLVAWIHRG